MRAEEEINATVDKISKLMMYGRFDEELLRSVKVKFTGAANFHVGQALALSPMMLDLKQFLVVNRSTIPFLISDNPVMTTNWFCRSRFHGRPLGGWARSGVQMLMAISPKHALLLHDGNIYTIHTVTNVIAATRDQTVHALNELQWLNAYKNVYFPPGMSDEYIQRFLAIAHGGGDLISLQRLENVKRTGLFRATDKDEFAAPTQGVTSELVRFGSRSLPKDIRIESVRLRSKPILHDDGSIASPMRDPAWRQIISDFASDLEAGACSSSDLWNFVERHPLVSKIGPWLGRMSRHASANSGP